MCVCGQGVEGNGLVEVRAATRRYEHGIATSADEASSVYRGT